MREQTMAEKLGYPPDARLLIIHCDDIGMSFEANAAVKDLLTSGIPVSCSVMIPCPWAYDFMQWYRNHPEFDVGIHVTLTSEWNTYRWRPLTGSAGLTDEDGFMPKRPETVVRQATVEEVRRETAAQIQQALDWGARPTHIDTHMGTSLASYEFAEAYITTAREFDLPPMILDPNPEMLAVLTEQGYDPRIVDLMKKETTPKLTTLSSTAFEETYEATKQAIYKQLENLPPGLSYFIIHPAKESDAMRTITASWQQRYWEYKIFMEEETRAKINELGIKLVTWSQLQAV